jgi:hypothetical protein
MTTPIDSWAQSWIIIHRSMPGGDWIIRGSTATLIGADFGYYIAHKPVNDNDRRR